jgi:HEAT repeat protein
MDALKTALAQLEHSDPDIRELALDTIGTLNPHNSFEIISPFISDPNPEIRETAACNLGDIQNDRSISILIHLANNDPSETVRAEALQALENYRSPEILQCLIDEINRKKQSRRPRQIVARQLQHYPDPQSIESLSYLLLSDEDVHVRIASADSLAALQKSPFLKTENVVSDLKFLTIWQRIIDNEEESTYIINLAIDAKTSLSDRTNSYAPCLQFSSKTQNKSHPRPTRDS